MQFSKTSKGQIRVYTTIFGLMSGGLGQGLRLIPVVFASFASFGKWTLHVIPFLRGCFGALKRRDCGREDWLATVAIRNTYDVETRVLCVHVPVVKEGPTEPSTVLYLESLSVLKHPSQSSMVSSNSLHRSCIEWINQQEEFPRTSNDSCSPTWNHNPPMPVWGKMSHLATLKEFSHSSMIFTVFIQMESLVSSVFSPNCRQRPRRGDPSPDLRRRPGTKAIRRGLRH